MSVGESERATPVKARVAGSRGQSVEMIDGDILNNHMANSVVSPNLKRIETRCHSPSTGIACLDPTRCEDIVHLGEEPKFLVKCAHNVTREAEMGRLPHGLPGSDCEQGILQHHLTEHCDNCTVRCRQRTKTHTYLCQSRTVSPKQISHTASTHTCLKQPATYLIVKTSGRSCVCESGPSLDKDMALDRCWQRQYQAKLADTSHRSSSDGIFNPWATSFHTQRLPDANDFYDTSVQTSDERAWPMASSGLAASEMISQSYPAPLFEDQFGFDVFSPTSMTTPLQTQINDGWLAQPSDVEAAYVDGVFADPNSAFTPSDLTDDNTYWNDFLTADALTGLDSDPHHAGQSFSPPMFDTMRFDSFDGTDLDSHTYSDIMTTYDSPVDNSVQATFNDTGTVSYPQLPDHQMLVPQNTELLMHDNGTPSYQSNSIIDRKMNKDKDRFLLECKQGGMSYKSIKKAGGFEEAESTLRGRYRTLTKPKEDRVRKPEWSTRDVSILTEIVAQHLARSRSSQNGSRRRQRALDRVSWKMVAEQMYVRGCYKYGNATVKKKYLEIMRTSASSRA